MTAPFAVSAQIPTPRAQQAVSSPRPLRRLLPRIRPYMWRLLAAFACLLASAGIALAFPQFVRQLLDAAFVSADADLLNKIALGLLGLFAIQAVLNFVQVYLYCIAGFTSIWLIFDVSDNISSFIDNHIGLAMVVRYYATQIPQVFIILLPVALLLSLLFALGRMSRANEIVSMLTAGVPEALAWAWLGLYGRSSRV